jgi:hypothetical protein
MWAFVITWRLLSVKFSHFNLLLWNLVGSIYGRSSLKIAHFVPMDRDEMSNLYRGPSIDASYQVSVNLAKQFQSRRFKKISQSSQQSFQRYLGFHWTFGPIEVELLPDQITFYWTQKKLHDLSAIFYSLVYSYIICKLSFACHDVVKSHLYL